MNTTQKGTVRYIVFKEKGTWYATALEFNIVESGPDPRIALINLFDAIEGYVVSARKAKGFRINPLLNQKTDPEYEKLWSIATASTTKKKAVASPYEINTYGVTSIK